jgi:peptide/nickel transport system ATP-binding protein
VPGLFGGPLHPYTRALLSAVPNPDPEVKLDFALGGEVADPADLPSGCSFHPRCPERQERCAVEEPALKDCGGRLVSCHFAGVEAEVE